MDRWLPLPSTYNSPRSNFTNASAEAWATIYRVFERHRQSRMGKQYSTAATMSKTCASCRFQAATARMKRKPMAIAGMAIVATRSPKPLGPSLRSKPYGARACSNGVSQRPATVFQAELPPDDPPKCDSTTWWFTFERITAL